MQKLKKDLKESQQQLADVTSQLTSVESKSGWFERRLAETEVNKLINKSSYVLIIVKLTSL